MSITTWKPVPHDFTSGQPRDINAGEYITYGEGCVLSVYYDSVQLMSDVYGTGVFAKWWNDATQNIETVRLDSWEYSRGNDPWSQNTATVDATEETWAKVYEHLYKIEYTKTLTAAQKVAAEMKKGDMVKIVKGRAKDDKGKSVLGTVGKVVVDCIKQYGMGYHSTQEHKFAVATSDVMVDKAAPNGKVYKNHRDQVWVWARNCELVQAKPIDMADVEETAKRHAAYELKLMQSTKGR